MGNTIHRVRLASVTIGALFAIFIFFPLNAAKAEDYPSRLVTLIVPYPAGGGVDTLGRLIAQQLSAALGQQVIIENRPGAGAVIGTRAAAKAPASAKVATSR